MSCKRNTSEDFCCASYQLGHWSKSMRMRISGTSHSSSGQVQQHDRRLPGRKIDMIITKACLALPKCNWTVSAWCECLQSCPGVGVFFESSECYLLPQETIPRWRFRVSGHHGSEESYIRQPEHLNLLADAAVDGGLPLTPKLLGILTTQMETWSSTRMKPPR